jgi:protein gp37
LLDCMAEASQHTFQVLTKRAERMYELVTAWLEDRTLAQVPRHIHLMVSVEDQEQAHGRIPWLGKIPCVRGLSVEPLLAPIPVLDLAGIHWVIAGGESGPNARPMLAAWVARVRDQCIASNVPFFFKQWGKSSNNPNPSDSTAKNNGGHAKGGRMLDGRTWDQMPLVGTAQNG